MKRVHMIDAIALLFTAGFFATVAALIFQVVPEANRATLNTLLGVLSVVQVKIAEHYSRGNTPEPDSAKAPTP